MSVETILDNLITRYPVLSSCKQSIWNAYIVMKEAFEQDKKLLVAGNGGSAADSEHIVGELMKGFVKSRTIDTKMKEKLLAIDEKRAESLCSNLQQALPAIALTGHTALSTAYLNDVDGILGFAQQVYGYGREHDVFFGITTSGNSENVLSAVVVAKARGLKTVVLTGRDGGKVKDMVDVAIVVPEQETYKIQELHLPIYHALCLMLEDYFFED